MPGEPAVPPSYPVMDPAVSTLPPLPETRTTQSAAFPQMTPAPAPAPAPAPDPLGSLAQAPAGPAMPPSDAPIFRREPVLEPAPAPGQAAAPAPNAPIFRSGGQTPPAGRTEIPASGNPATGAPQWEVHGKG